MQKEIESAYQTALKKKDDLAIFFGDMEYESRWADMLCDGKVQYHNYSVLCPMWGMWQKDYV